MHVQQAQNDAMEAIKPQYRFNSFLKLYLKK